MGAVLGGWVGGVEHAPIMSSTASKQRKQGHQVLQCRNRFAELSFFLFHTLRLLFFLFFFNHFYKLVLWNPDVKNALIFCARSRACTEHTCHCSRRALRWHTDTTASSGLFPSATSPSDATKMHQMFWQIWSNQFLPHKLLRVAGRFHIVRRRNFMSSNF